MNHPVIPDIKATFFILLINQNFYLIYNIYNILLSNRLLLVTLYNIYKIFNYIRHIIICKSSM